MDRDKPLRIGGPAVVLILFDLGALSLGIDARPIVATIPHLPAVSLMRPLTMPQDTKNGFFVHWI